MRIPIVAMCGMGEDSYKGIRRWIESRSSRDFDLEDLIILTSQTIAESRKPALDIKPISFLIRMTEYRAVGLKIVQLRSQSEKQMNTNEQQ